MVDYHGFQYFAFTCCLTCKLQEDQEANLDKGEEEDVQQLVFRIGGSWRDWEGYPDITR